MVMGFGDVTSVIGAIECSEVFFDFSNALKNAGSMLAVFDDVTGDERRCRDRLLMRGESRRFRDERRL